MANASEHLKVVALAERTLSKEELDAYVNAPKTDEERQEILELHAWFVRRYPTVLERFAYNRRAHRRWQQLRQRTGSDNTK